MKNICSLDLAYASLPNLERKIVGVKLIKTLKEYDKFEAREITGVANYCQLIKSASVGNVIKAKEENFRCKSGAWALGLLFEDYLNSMGENWTKLGLHKDLETSRKIREEVEFLDEKNYGVLIGPAEKINVKPDLYLIFGNPYILMRLIQGYTYYYGRVESLSFMGNMAVCFEASARPIKTGEINISTLCVGTRHKARWDDNEMLMGIPDEKFEKTIQGVVNTVNIMETNENKEKIEKNLESLGIFLELELNYNYYMDC